MENTYFESIEQIDAKLIELQDRLEKASNKQSLIILIDSLINIRNNFVINEAKSKRLL